MTKKKKKAKASKLRKPSPLRLDPRDGLFEVLKDGNTWMVVTPSGCFGFNAKQCRKLANWLQKASAWIEQGE